MVELNLTKRQQEIFDFIKRYSAQHGYPPTVRDIGKAIGLTSSSTEGCCGRSRPISSRARGFVGSRFRSPARSRFARCAWTVEGEVRPTARPMSRTVGG